MPNIFKDGGGAGIGSYVVVFKDGQLAENTDLAKVRGAYESGDSIFISIIDEGTEDALVPASGWIDEEAKLHLVARDFDDNKTYSLELGSDPTEPIEAKVEDGIEAGGEPLGGSVKAEDGKLLVSEVVMPVGPVPVAEFDGVEYFHKQEFDLEAIAATSFEQQNTLYLNLLTGELYSDAPGYVMAYMDTRSTGPNTQYAVVLNAGLRSGSGAPKDYVIFPSPARPVDYTSKSFVCTDADRIGDGEIHLPTCSAYYGFLSEDGKTFISYYNLKGEGPAEVAPVTKIKDASNHEVEIHDARIDVVPEAVTLDGTSLVIPESGNKPTPIATFDGIDYYNEHTINIQETLDTETVLAGGELKIALPDMTEPGAKKVLSLHFYNRPDQGRHNANICFADSSGGISNFYPQPNDYSHIVNFDNFIGGSKLLDTYYQVGGNAPIDTYNSLSSDGITALYLIYDPDTTDLKIYDNGSGLPSSIDSVRQGNSVIPLVDNRVDSLQEEINSKQNLLTAGENITIVNNVISASVNVEEYKEIELLSETTWEDVEQEVGTDFKGKVKFVYSSSGQTKNTYGELVIHSNQMPCVRFTEDPTYYTSSMNWHYYETYSRQDNAKTAIASGMTKCSIPSIAIPSASDAGKILKVNDSGTPVWSTSPASGTELYRHRYELQTAAATVTYLDVITPSPYALAGNDLVSLLSYVNSAISLRITNEGGGGIWISQQAWNFLGVDRSRSGFCKTGDFFISSKDNQIIVTYYTGDPTITVSGNVVVENENYTELVFENGLPTPEITKL